MVFTQTDINKFFSACCDFRGGSSLAKSRRGTGGYVGGLGV